MSNTSPNFLASVEVSVRWRDMDALGHVNNSTFFSYFEEARMEWWKQKNLPYFYNEPGAPVIAHATCTYKKPIHYPETLLIKIYSDGPKNSSFECFYELYSKKDPDVFYAHGSTRIVWVDKQTGRPINLPDYIREILSI